MCLKVVELYLKQKQAEILTMLSIVLFLVKKTSEPQAAQMTMLPSETRWPPLRNRTNVKNKILRSGWDSINGETDTLIWALACPFPILMGCTQSLSSSFHES